MILLISIFAIVNLSYWIFIFSRFSFHKAKNTGVIDNNGLINNATILISAKNEEQNLKRNLITFIDQKPSGFELLIVDDHSHDSSIEYLEKQKFKYNELKIIKNKYNEGKKQALSFGISKTNNEYIALTDADCYAASDKWLQLMISGFNDDASDIILGYSPYIGKGFLISFIRFETFQAALQYFSYALAGMPYMGVGRNMAIRKSTFLKNKGYENQMDIKSGSDDLLVSEAARSGNISLQYDPDSFVYTHPVSNFFDFFRQKSRHISTSFRYKFKHRMLLGLYAFSHIAFYSSLIICLINQNFTYPILILLVRYVIIYFCSFRAFIRLKEVDLMVWLPVFDFLMFIYYILLSFFYYFYPKNRWK